MGISVKAFCVNFSKFGVLSLEMHYNYFGSLYYRLIAVAYSSDSGGRHLRKEIQ